jgi:hypothetical protein
VLGSAAEPSVAPGDGSAEEIQRLREELRLCRLELARAREEQEAVTERQAQVRRSKAKAEKEAEILAKALSDALFRQTREHARAKWWQVGTGRVSRHEWEQVQILRQSRFFRPAWYLRENLDVARAGIEPAMHFLRKGHKEGRDPAPSFNVKRYVDKHPEVRRSGTNPLIHALEMGNTPPPKSKKKSKK